MILYDKQVLNRLPDLVVVCPQFCSRIIARLGSGVGFYRNHLLGWDLLLLRISGFRACLL